MRQASSIYAQQRTAHLRGSFYMADPLARGCKTVLTIAPLNLPSLTHDNAAHGTSREDGCPPSRTITLSRGMPTTSDVDVNVVEDYVRKGVKEGGAEALPRRLAHMHDKQAASLTATKGVNSKTACVKAAVNAGSARSACHRRELGHQWMPDRILELPDAAVKEGYFADSHPLELFALAPHQRVQASLSIMTGELVSTSPTDRRLVSMIGGTWVALPPVLQGLTGRVRESVRQNLLAPSLVCGEGHTIRVFVDLGMQADNLRTVIPHGVVAWAGGNSRHPALTSSMCMMRCGTTQRLQAARSKLVVSTRFRTFTTSLDALSEGGRARGPESPTPAWNLGEWRERGTGVCAKRGRWPAYEGLSSISSG